MSQKFEIHGNSDFLLIPKAQFHSLLEERNNLADEACMFRYRYSNASCELTKMSQKYYELQKAVKNFLDEPFVSKLINKDKE